MATIRVRLPQWHSGLVIAEVELDTTDQAIDLPEWIGVELTHDRLFSKSALSLTETAPSETAPS